MGYLYHLAFTPLNRTAALTISAKERATWHIHVPDHPRPHPTLTLDPALLPDLTSRPSGVCHPIMSPVKLRITNNEAKERSLLKGLDSASGQQYKKGKHGWMQQLGARDCRQPNGRLASRARTVFWAPIRCRFAAWCLRYLGSGGWRQLHDARSSQY